jgi:hypothetical protein
MQAGRSWHDGWGQGLRRGRMGGGREAAAGWVGARVGTQLGVFSDPIQR